MILSRTDGAGNIIKPGDVCVRQLKGKLEYVIYKKDVYGGEGSRGEYGKFITEDGQVTIKFSSVLLAYDSKGDRIPKVTTIIRKYFEDK